MVLLHSCLCIIAYSTGLVTLCQQTILPWQETHPQVQRYGDPLPTFEAFRVRSAKMRSKTVQDVWGLMLTSVPGESYFCVNQYVTV